MAALPWQCVPAARMGDPKKCWAAQVEEKRRKGERKPDVGKLGQVATATADEATEKQTNIDTRSNV